MCLKMDFAWYIDIYLITLKNKVDKTKLMLNRHCMILFH